MREDWERIVDCFFFLFFWLCHTVQLHLVYYCSRVMDQTADSGNDERYIDVRMFSEEGNVLSEAPVILPLKTTVEQLQVCIQTDMIIW